MFYGKWLVLSLMLLSFNVTSNNLETNMKLGLEYRYFPDKGKYEEQFEHHQYSTFAEAEVYWNWNNGDDLITFKPYYRYDNQDKNRSHGDIREFSYIHVDDNYEFRAGFRKEFWGVTEFQHLVDVINQTDLVEDIDGEEKLGQLMFNLSSVYKWGIVDWFLLPSFRERTFASEQGRLRAPIKVDVNNAIYQSSAKQKHLDFAVRWNHSIGNFDIGSYWFHGTNRDPVLQLSDSEINNTDGSNTQSFIPYYQQMDQFGIDLQATVDSWLWKVEGIYRHTDIDSFLAAQVGLEYTFVGALNSVIDIGFLMEYAWDARGETTNTNIGANFQNDLFIGSRLAFNDMQSSEILVGLRSDMQHNSFSLSVEGSRRMGDNYKINVDFRAFQSNEPLDAFYYLKSDNHFQVSIERFF